MDGVRGFTLLGFHSIQPEIDSKLTPQFQGGRSGPSRGRSHKSAPATASPKSSEAIRPLDPTLTPPDITTFRHWELGEEIQVAIEGMGITVPSPIQRLAIGPVLAGKDVIAKAETGTGKTLAFGAPMMAKIDPQRASVLGLVMCPTRELAEQVQKVLSELGKPRGIEVALIVGGEPMEPQIKALKRGAQVVVGTPGRILDLYKQRFLSFPWTEFAILDEADVMFEFGFIDDVKEILSYTPEERQTLLFSATFPVELLKLARENTRDPAEVATAAGLKTVDNIEQSVIFLDDEDRTLALMRLIENSDPEDTFLVFCPRRTDVDKLIRRLERMPFSIKALHGGYDQAARFRVMAAFRTGEVKALIATDVASRGLDVKHVSTVVNYGSPHDITDYTHRIGRTGRAGRKGRAITLVGGIDRRKWTQIEREATWKIPEVDPPLRGERPRPRRDETPVVVEQPAAEVTSPAREESPRRESPPREARARNDGPREQRPGREAGPANAPSDRAENPRRGERPVRARDEHAPAARSNAGRGEPRPSSARADGPRQPSGTEGRSWPRDEHSPVRPEAPIAREQVRQIEPRPDDPIDRRDRPLRQRAEPPHWPADDEAPAREERARRDEAPREETPRQGAPRADAPRGQATRGDAQRADAPRADAPRARAPRAEAPRAEPTSPRSGARDAGPRTDRPARSDAAPSRANARNADAARVPFFPPEDAEPENDFRPRGPDSGSASGRTTSSRAPQSAGSPSRAPAGRPPAAARRGEDAPPARETRREEAPRRASPAHGTDAEHEPRVPAGRRSPAAPRAASAARPAEAPRGAPAPRGEAPARNEPARRADSGRTGSPRSESAPRAREESDAPRGAAHHRGAARSRGTAEHREVTQPRDAAPHRAAAPRSSPAPRGEATSRSEISPRSASAPRRESAPRADAAPRSAAPPRSAAAPRSESVPRSASAPRSRAEAPPPPPRPLAPRRRIDPGQVDPGEVRPIQSRRREPRPEREI